MRIEKHPHDKNYPYTLIGDWGQEMSCSREDLIALKHEINRVLDQPRQPPLLALPLAVTLAVKWYRK